MTVGDFVAMERGYWDERADEEEGRALTVLLTTQNQKKENTPFELRDIMQKWAWVHKGYDKASKSKMQELKNKYEATRLAQQELHKRQN
jgi:hypothetical protein